jgi:hypothetical protein
VPGQGTTDIPPTHQRRCELIEQLQKFGASPAGPRTQRQASKLSALSDAIAITMRTSNPRQPRGFDMTKAGKWYRSIALLFVAFSIPPSLVLVQSLNGPGNIYVRGRSDSVEEAGILRTGTMLAVDTPARPAPDVYPSLAGSYTSSAQHPRVFVAPAELTDMVRRINSTGSFSAQIFSRLVGQIKSDLAAKKDWDAVYSGCDIDIYLHTFSYEPAGGYADQIRSASQLSTAMNVKQGTSPPAGAAIVASRVALYAALVKTGAKMPAGAPTADQAATLAKRILLAWANHGFRDQNGNFLSRAEQFCDGQGHFIPLSQSATGLQIARGVIYSVHAQDLLQSIGAVNDTDANQLNTFHAAMFDLIREASNFAFNLPEVANTPYRTCERFSNHFNAHLMGLLAIARLFDDGRKFNAVLYGNDPSISVDLFWTKYFNHATYGYNDKPIPCYKNSAADSLTSKGSFQTPTVAPGEVEDRYRHANPGQTFGYTTGVLADFLVTGDMLKNAGFDAFRYRGVRGQTIQLSVDYYSCYGKTPGFKQTVTAENARTCPGYQEYIGQTVNGLETGDVMGAYHFPQDPLLNELDAPAKAGAGPNLIDPIRFGRWRD